MNRLKRHEIKQELRHERNPNPPAKQVISRRYTTVHGDYYMELTYEDGSKGYMPL